MNNNGTANIAPVPVEDQVRPEVPVKIGNLQFTLTYGMDAIEYLFDQTGVSLLEGLDPALMRQPKMLIEFLMAGTREYNGEITKKDLSKVIGVNNLGTILQAVIRACGITLPDAATVERIEQMMPSGGKEPETAADKSASPLPEPPEESAASGQVPDTTSVSA